MNNAVIRLSYQPPVHGWLLLRLTVNENTVEIDASDVRNNPVKDLVTALALIATGAPACIWWHLEPDGYFMHFTPKGDSVVLRVDFAVGSEKRRARHVLQVEGSRKAILLPLWRFVREFESHAFTAQHWPLIDYSGMAKVKANISR